MRWLIVVLTACGRLRFEERIDEADSMLLEQAVRCPTDPVARWALDDGVGSSVASDSGAKHDGTLANVDLNTAWVEGVRGGALRFDGANDAVSVTHDSDFDVGTRAMTIAAWVRIGEEDTMVQLILDHFIGGPVGEGWFLGHDDNPDGFIKFNHRAMGGEANEIVLLTQREMADRQWHHYAVIIGNGRARMLVDAIEVASDTYDMLIDHREALRFGCCSAPLPAFRGELDDVRLYHRELDVAEVEVLVNDPNCL